MNTTTKWVIAALLSTSVFAGCHSNHVKQLPKPATRVITPAIEIGRMETGLPTQFEGTFDKLFLSKEPLHYQNNDALLRAIDLDKITQMERSVLRVKLCAFLSSDQKGRSYTPDCTVFGVAGPIEVLRFHSVTMLGQIGQSEDIDCIRGAMQARSFEHPGFRTACSNALEMIQNR